MNGTATATTLAISSEDSSNKVVVDPSPREIANARSIHVLAFTSHDDLLISESEGSFTIAEWGDVVAAARKRCCQRRDETGLDTVMGAGDEASTDMRHFIRSTMATSTATALNWKPAA